jgi:indolepyruvate decarboxylase
MAYSAADYIIERLIQQKVEALFGVPAVYCAALYAAAARVNPPAPAPAVFRTIVTSSDLEAGYAADGYARVRGLSAIGVAYGVGTLSLINAVAGAYLERSPIVIVNGGPSQSNIDLQTRTGVLFSHSMGLPHSDLDAFRPFTAFCERATSRADIPRLVDQALVAAITRKHPVYIEIPQAWLGMDCPRPARDLDLAIPPGTADQSATLILQEIRAAKHPFVIVGVEIQRYGLAAQLLKVLDKLGIRWATTLLAKSALPEQHAGFQGVFNGEKAPSSLTSQIAASDLIVALGAVFGSGHASLMIPQYPNTIRIWDGKIIAHGKPSQPVGIPSLIAALDRLSVLEASVHYDSTVDYTGKHGQDGDGESAWDGDRGTDPEQPAVQEDTRGILTPVSNGLAYQELFDVIAEPAFLDPTLTIIADTFLGIYPAARLSMPTSNCFITSALWASIGHAVGAGVGAWIPREKRPVVVCGDGGFQMVAHSLSTMAKYKHDTIVIIVDNGLYGYEQYLLSQTYYNNPGENPLPYAVLSSWDYEKLARAMGIGEVLTANSAASLRAALAAAKANMASPTVIHALVASRSLPAGL